MHFSIRHTRQLDFTGRAYEVCLRLAPEGRAPVVRAQDLERWLKRATILVQTDSRQETVEGPSDRALGMPSFRARPLLPDRQSLERIPYNFGWFRFAEL